MDALPGPIGLEERHQPTIADVSTQVDALIAAIYLRQSLDKTGEGDAVDRQREDAIKLAKLRGWDVARIEMDNDTRGRQTPPSRL